jgi:hypothetical protein
MLIVYFVDSIEESELVSDFHFHASPQVKPNSHESVLQLLSFDD